MLPVLPNAALMRGIVTTIDMTAETATVRAEDGKTLLFSRVHMVLWHDWTALTIGTPVTFDQWRRPKESRAINVELSPPPQPDAARSLSE